MVPILITTLGRVNNQVTLANLSQSPYLAPHVALVVQHHEAAIHREKHPDATIYVLPKGINNLGPTRNYILNNTGLFGSKDGKVILLDDDLDFYWRPDPDDWHLHTPGPRELEQMFEEIEAALDDYAHVGVSGREGNNRILYYATESTRYMRVLAYNTQLIPEDIPIGRIHGMSDFDLNLCLLRAGLPSKVFYRWAQGHKSTQTPGGCSITRNHQTHSDEIDQMLVWHDGFVRARIKENKTGGEFGKRRELTIYWKKALASSGAGE